MARLGEFDFIAEMLRPLSEGAPGALNLQDDAALMAPDPGCELVITADTLIAGRHFLHGLDPALVARKALRANLSDLAAMGADARWYLTAIVWPVSIGADEQRRFVAGLAEDQALFGVTLIGGDTTSGFTPLTVSITAIGQVKQGEAVKRSGAKPGDRLYVSGTIGDAGLGLKIAQDALEASNEDRAFLLRRHDLPTPRLNLAAALRAHAGAAIDVSDGLIADTGHIAGASRIKAVLELDLLPLSDPARAWLDRQDDDRQARIALATSGDDYELVCAVSPESAEAFETECRKAGIPVTQIGRCEAGERVEVTYGGEPVTIDQAGFTHF